MPPLPPVPQVVKLEVSGVINDCNWVNIFHLFYAGGDVTSSAIGNLNSHISSALDAIYHDYGNIALTETLRVYTDLASDTGVVVGFDEDISGVESGTVLPASACVLASWEIARRYRGGHPRTYFPIGDSGTLASDSSKTWDTTFLEDVSAACETFRGACSWVDTSTGITWAMCSISYTHDGAARPIPIHDIVTSTILRTRVCSQRRRLGKTGG